MIKNITFNAEDSVIRKARERAMREKKSLNVVFREWLGRYIHQDAPSGNYQKLMKKISYASPGKKFSRSELNER